MMVRRSIFFIHGGRVVRGSLKRRVANHKMLIRAHCYIGPDGNDIGPAVLDFARTLGHEEVYADAGAALALVAGVA